MNIQFSDEADKELKEWLKSSKSTAKKIYELIGDIKKYGVLGGRGKPEQLKHHKNPPKYSRHITKGDRLVYRPYIEVNDKDLLIISCKGHYDDT